MNLFFECLQTSTPITYEVVPPRGFSVDFLQPVIDIQEKLAGITITDNPMATMRINPIVFGSYVRDKFSVPIIPNLSCRDRNLLALQSELLGAHLLGFRDIFIITGDHPIKNDDFKGVWEVHSKDLCKIVKNLNRGTANDKGVLRKLETPTDFNIGGAIILNRKNEMDTFKSKITYGFNFFITQITYNAEEVIDFISKIDGDVTPPIQVGLSPISSARRFKRVANMTGLDIPENTYYKLINADDFEESILSHLLEQADQMRSQLDYPIGFHIMPIGSEELGGVLVKELKL